MDRLIALDKHLLIFLNGLGSERFDVFWKIITDQFCWIPIFVLALYFIYRKLGWRNLCIIALFVALLITFVDQTTNLVKAYFQRPRPCSDPEIKDMIRIVMERSSYGFFSGHASGSMANATFVFLILRRFYRHAYLCFIFPLLFAYSRIYLGVHFPADILVGYAYGALSGYAFYRLYCYLGKKYKFGVDIAERIGD
ncbi:MAG: phosphatase PAP2 family protein [Bacteroidales bacterium]